MLIEIDQKLLKSLLVMGAVVAAKDPYTAGHLRRVGQFGRLAAEALGLPGGEAFTAEVGGRLHDLGKVGISDALLMKPGKLTQAEHTSIRSHARIGGDIIAEHPLAPLAEDAILHHHEFYNGHGYPDGLVGESISMVTRIVSACDALDAMTSARAYRGNVSLEDALSILRAERGRQFDPAVVDVLSDLGSSDRLCAVVGDCNHERRLLPCDTCGTMMVVTRLTPDGGAIYCPVCSGKYRVERVSGEWSQERTGTGTFEELTYSAATIESLDAFVARAPTFVHLS